MSDTHITPEHRRAFKALTSGDYENFALFSCTVNGAPPPRPSWRSAPTATTASSARCSCP